jgi:hypothetical protein
MLTAVVLVCSLGITPDIKICGRDNAVMVMPLPETFASPAACFLQGQAYLARTSLGRTLRAEERVKVVCMPQRLLAEADADGVPVRAGDGIGSPADAR